MNFSLASVDAAPLGVAGAQAPVLRGLTLAGAEGEALAVIGPSGAGKTTLLHLLACALRPSAGRYQVGADERPQGRRFAPSTPPRMSKQTWGGPAFSCDPWALSRADLRALRGKLVLAPQVPPLPPRQRVVTAVLAGCLPAWSLAHSLRSLIYPADIAAAHAALAAFDLAEKLFERVDRLSGGERQRVGLARVWVAPAKLWLLDEPLSALDPLRTNLAAQALVREAGRRGVTLVASLHHVEMALAHFPRIVGLRQGQVLFDLPAAQVTPDLLAQLYAQHEEELGGALAAPVSRQASLQQMPCR